MTETPQQHRVNTEHLRDYSQLRRSLTDRKVAGVAGGLGRHLNIDPTILRVAFVVLCFFGGAGFVLYGAAWLFVPEDGQERAPISTSPSTRNALLIGAAVIAGLLLVGDSWGGFWFPWPLAVIALIVFVVLMNRDKPMSSTNPPGQWAAGDPAPGATTTLPPQGATGDEPTTQFGPQPPAPPWMPPTQQAYQPPAPRPDRGPKLFWVTLALIAIALGTLGLYDVSGGSVTDAAYPALGLAVVGAMLVVGAWVGRAGGLILLGIIGALALAATSVADPRFDGERRIDLAPTSAAQVQDEYFVPAGSIELDLTRVSDLAALDGREIDVEANAGEILVTVPEGLAVDVQADISMAGSARVAGFEQNGPDVFIDQRIPAQPGAPEIELNLELLVGSIEVRQER
jgi:phage shock protein PspC (stress-responsive transcriptional regulator)